MFKFSMTKIQLNTLLITAVTYYVQTLYCYVMELTFDFMGVGDHFDVWYISSSVAVACFFKVLLSWSNNYNTYLKLRTTLAK